MTPTSPPPTAEERLKAASEQLSRTLSTWPSGLPLPALPDIDLTSRIDALATLLAEHGIIPETAFVDRMNLIKADKAEDIVRQVQAAKRQAMGIVIPGAGQAI